jgi:hypothetical protein
LMANMVVLVDLQVRIAEQVARVRTGVALNFNFGEETAVAHGDGL